MIPVGIDNHQTVSGLLVEECNYRRDALAGGIPAFSRLVRRGRKPSCCTSDEPECRRIIVNRAIFTLFCAVFTAYSKALITY